MNFTTVFDNNCIVKCPNHLLEKLHIQTKKNCTFLFLKNKLGKSVSFFSLSRFNSRSNHIVNRCSTSLNLHLNDFFQQIWKKNEAKDFTTFDTKLSSHYDALCDPYLKHFFKRKDILNVNVNLHNKSIVNCFIHNHVILHSNFVRTS